MEKKGDERRRRPFRSRESKYGQEFNSHTTERNMVNKKKEYATYARPFPEPGTANVLRNIGCLFTTVTYQINAELLQDLKCSQ